MIDDIDNKKTGTGNKKSDKMSLGEYLVFGLILVVLHIFINEYVCFIGRIPSNSMSSYLNVGDAVLVNRLAYKNKEPKTGDIIVFNGWVDDNLFIKRVLGTPGDTVDIIDGYVVLNGETLDDVNYEAGYTDKFSRISKADIEYPLTIPKDCYFVLGDNRENSIDSRILGLVDKEKVVGESAFKVSIISKIFK